MKNLRICLVLISVLATLSAVSSYTLPNHSNTIVYALDSAGIIRDTAWLGSDGSYQFNSLKPGIYNLKFKSVGNPDIWVNGVEHLEPTIRYHAKLDLKPVRNTEPVKAPEGDIIALDVGASVDYDGIEPSRDVESMSGGSPGSGKSTLPELKSVESRAHKYTVKKVRSPVFMDKDDLKDSRSGSSTHSTAGFTGSSETTAVEMEKAGQLTAGFWRDLDNWDKWKETNKNAAIAAHQKTWNFYPENRFSVRYVNTKGEPVIGEKVELKDAKGNVIWTAVTDNSGKVELWSNLNSSISEKPSEYKVKITIGERVFESNVKSGMGVPEIVNIPVASKTVPVAEIAFVVDATGSMGDEIKFLQAEILDVISRVKKTNQCIDFKMGSVFYRDRGDSYLTRTSELSSNPLQVVDFILNQSAGGGGDFPEAVDAAMETAVNDLKWSDKSICKLMFLILDAPPHNDSVSVHKMNKYTKMAASKGIKIIPVMASGIDQSTEFLMKYLSIATNGTYVYITDHSGIGNSHSKPTGVKENVQYLNDLMVDIINQNSAWDGCTDSSGLISTVQKTVEIISNGQWQAQIYPNPAVDYIIIKSNLIPDAIDIWSLSGNKVKSVEQLTEKMKINISDLVTGVYFVKCRKGEQQISCRILIMH